MGSWQYTEMPSCKIMLPGRHVVTVKHTTISNLSDTSWMFIGTSFSFDCGVFVC